VARAPALEELDLGGAELGLGLEFDDGDASVEALCGALGRLRGLERLLLPCNRLVGLETRPSAAAGAAAAEGDARYLAPLAAAVRASTRLRELDLTGNYLGPAAGLAMAEALAEAAAGLADPVAQLRLGDSLHRAPLSVPALRAGPALALCRPLACELAAAGVLARGCARLESVRVNGYQGGGPAALLAPALRGAGARLVRLRLRSVGLLAADAEQLADALGGAASLEELALPWNPGFGVRGTTAVARAVRGCGALASLDLSMCALARLCRMDDSIFAVPPPTTFRAQCARCA
jgi:hypothetical protein